MAWAFMVACGNQSSGVNPTANFPMEAVYIPSIKPGQSKLSINQYVGKSQRISHNCVCKLGYKSNIHFEKLLQMQVFTLIYFSLTKVQYILMALSFRKFLNGTNLAAGWLSKMVFVCFSDHPPKPPGAPGGGKGSAKGSGSSKKDDGKSHNPSQ